MFSDEIANSFVLPSPHFEELSTRQTGGYFAWNLVLSPELGALINKFEREFKKIISLYFSLKKQ